MPAPPLPWTVGNAGRGVSYSDLSSNVNLRALAASGSQASSQWSLRLLEEVSGRTMCSALGLPGQLMLRYAPSYQGSGQQMVKVYLSCG